VSRRPSFTDGFEAAASGQAFNAIQLGAIFAAAANGIRTAWSAGRAWVARGAGGKAAQNALKTDVTPTPKQIEKFSRQLKEHGKPSVERSQRKIQRRLDEHYQKLDDINNNGGYGSSVEREIRNFERELEAINRTLGN